MAASFRTPPLKPASDAGSRSGVSSPARQGGLSIAVALVHLVGIALIVHFGSAAPKVENLFKVKIGGSELSHDYIVGMPERLRPGRLPDPEPAPAPEPVPAPEVEPAPAPKEPGIDLDAIRKRKEQAKKKRLEEAKKKYQAQQKKKKLEAEKKKRLEAAKKKFLEDRKKKRLEAAKKRYLEEQRKKRAAEARQKAEEARKRWLEKLAAEKARKQQEEVYRPNQSGPIGAGGSNTNRNVPIGSRDAGQAYGPPDHKTPGGGQDAKLSDYAQGPLKRFLEAKWSQPPDSLLGGKRPQVTLELTISASGKVEKAVILRTSGIKAMDDSIKLLLGSLDQLPTPPRAVTLQYVMCASD